MTEYQMIEISNQQVFRDKPAHAPHPAHRTHATNKPTPASATLKPPQPLTTTSAPTKSHFDARGRLLTASHQPPPNGEAHYHLTYNLTESAVRNPATVRRHRSNTHSTSSFPSSQRSSEPVTQSDPKTIRITKPNGTLTIRTDAPQGFDPIPQRAHLQPRSRLRGHPRSPSPCIPAKPFQIRMEAAPKK